MRILTSMNLKYGAKWKKPDATSSILCDSIYMKYPEKANLWRQKAHH